jgi:hypothetical protein
VQARAAAPDEIGDIEASLGIADLARATPADFAKP